MANIKIYTADGFKLLNNQSVYANGSFKELSTNAKIYANGEWHPFNNDTTDEVYDETYVGPLYMDTSNFSLISSDITNIPWLIEDASTIGYDRVWINSGPVAYRISSGGSVWATIIYWNYLTYGPTTVNPWGEHVWVGPGVTAEANIRVSTTPFDI